MTSPNYRKEDVLIDALPYIQEFENKIFVIKYGGAVMEDESLKQTVAQDVTLLRKIGIDVVIVHGGGKAITSLSNKLNLDTKFINGQRYTDEMTVEVVQMVLAGLINKDIVRRINIHGGNAVGISGIDGKLITVEKSQNEELGLVGKIIGINADLLKDMLRSKLIPVIAPMGVDENGTVYNINADIAAAEIAASLNAVKLVFMTDVEGVKVNDKLISHLFSNDVEKLINEGIITGGMIPKVSSALEAINLGVSKVHIIDGRAIHALLLEIFTTEGIGTEIVSDL